MQWLQDTNQKKKLNNLKRVRRGANKHFRSKKKEYLKTKIDEVQTNRKIENNSDFKKSYRLRNNIVKDKKSD